MRTRGTSQVIDLNSDSLNVAFTVLVNRIVFSCCAKEDLQYLVYIFLWTLSVLYDV